MLNIKRQIVFVAVLFLLLGAGAIFFWAQKSNSSSIEAVVTAFCKELANKDKDKLKGFLTNVPDYVWRKAYLSDKSLIGDPGDSGTESTNSGIPSVRPSTPGKLSSERLVQMNVPNLFFTQDRFLKKVVSIKQNGNEAKLRIDLGSRNKELADVEYDFLMYKETDGWKIFDIRDVRPAITNPYFFYAESNY